MASTTRFAAYPSAVVYANKNGTKPVQHLLWGDWLRLKSGRSGNYRQVRARGVDGWMHKDDFQWRRRLEVTCVDVGQGDGCLLVTPDDKHIVIDAGATDNMHRYLRWRYGGFAKPWQFEAGIISHPDADHYAGFEDIFHEPNVTFGCIYHNGIVERKAKKSLGPTVKFQRRNYLVDLVPTTQKLRDFLSVTSRWKRKKYPTMLNLGLSNRSFGRFTMLSSKNGFMPGYGADQSLNIKVLGPIPETVTGGRDGLRSFGSKGKTKNGHSVVLKLEYNNVSMLLGGDLNIPAEKYLMSVHTGGLDPSPKDIQDRHTLISAARQVFQVDIAKSCHHGSADFTNDFLEAVNPIATVISSGDDEPHSHPRADTLGTLGANSRGVRPLIFSTELARSTKETIKHPNALRAKLMDLREEIESAPTDTAAERRKRDKKIKEFNKVVGSIERSVAVFGAIFVRTDGNKVVMAQKLERPRSAKSKWDIYKLEPTANGVLEYKSKH